MSKAKKPAKAPAKKAKVEKTNEDVVETKKELVQTPAGVIDQNQINRKLWQMCDTFRGTIDSGAYKNYILSFLFLKYLSDVWKDHYAKYSTELKGDKERINRRMERERFILPKNCSYDYLYEHRDDSNLGQLINDAMENIEEANKSWRVSLAVSTSIQIKLWVRPVIVTSDLKTWSKTLLILF